jgi:hypothetical protein
VNEGSFFSAKPGFMTDHTAKKFADIWQPRQSGGIGMAPQEKLERVVRPSSSGRREGVGPAVPNRGRQRGHAGGDCGFRLPHWRGLQGEFQRENGAQARALALDGQSAAHFLRRQRAAVQAETVAFGAGGKAMIENPVEVLGRNADAIVNH